jgi:OmpR family response regulator RpaB
MQQILLIDDDIQLAELLGEYFARFDLQLISALTPSDGLSKLNKNPVDLIILDVMLPEKDGFEVCKEIRRHNAIPIIMLTARGDVMDRVVGLELGADDYLPKPFEPRELVARINSILKRSQQTQNHNGNLQFGALTIDTHLHEARLGETPLALSSMEYQLLLILANAAGDTLSRDDILNHLKGIDSDIYTRSVDIAISRLRQKLKPNDYIKTVRGSGYVFVGNSQ